MKDECKNPTQAVSRRALMLAEGGGATLAATAAALRPAAAQNKMGQKAAQYRDRPKGDQSCGNCNYFEPPSSCKLVAGDIKPAGWCILWAKKQS